MLATDTMAGHYGGVIEVRPGGRRRIDRVLAPEYLAGIEERPLAQVRELRDEADQEETDLSYLRRLLHGRIDIVRAEQRRRTEGESTKVVEHLAKILSENAVAATSSFGRHRTLEPSRAQAHRRYVEALVSDVDLSDVTTLTDDKLAAVLGTYQAEESSISERRRQVQRVVDTCNAEIGNRYAQGSASVDELLDAERDKG